MLYQDYKQKMKRMVDIFHFIWRIRVPIIAVISTILVLLTAYLATKGIVYGGVLDDNTIEYGDKPSFSASAIFSEVSYEYRHEGSQEWTSEVPTRMGNYYVRAIASGSFGTRYGKEQAFTIGARHIEALIKDGDVVYGENPSVTADLAFGDTIHCTEYVFDNTILASTSVIAVKDKISVKDEKGNDVTGCYVITPKARQITFAKRPITMTVGSSEKVYDGKPLKYDDVWWVSEGNLVFGDIVVKVEGTFSVIIGAGQVDNKGSFKVLRPMKDGGVADVTHQYQINQQAGTLTVTQRPVTIYPQGGEYVYDGKAHFEKLFTIDVNTPLAEGDTAVVDEAPSITAVGEIENLIILKILDADGESIVTSNYCFTYAGDLFLRVTKRDVTIDTPSLELVYDGLEHKAENGKVNDASSLAEGHSLAIKSATSIKDVGEEDNVLEFIVKDANGSDVSANYNLSYINGKLKITKRPIEITSQDLDGIYNGKEQYAHSVTSPEGQLAEGHKIVPSFSNTVKYCNVTVENLFEVQILDENGEDVTHNYEYTRIYGELKVSPLAVSIATGSESKVYDGYELSNPEFSYLGEGKFAEGEEIRYINPTKRVNYGKEDNIFTIEIYEGEENITYNYIITYDEYGTLEIEKRPITVTALSFEKMYYDGLAYENPGYEIGGLGLADDQYENVVVEAEDYINAGYWKNQIISVEIFDLTDTPATENYEITYVDGEITVGQRPIIIVSAQFSHKVYYDGEKHYLNQAYVLDLNTEPDANIGFADGATPITSFSLVEGHNFEVSFLDESYVVKASEPKLNYFNLDRIYIEATDEDVTSNYAPSYIYGELRLEKRPVTIVSDSMAENSQVYDGYTHTLHSFTVSDTEGMGLVSGHEAWASYTGSIVNAGQEENSFEIYEIIDRSYDSVFAEYTVTHRYGTLRVFPRPVTFTSQSAEKIYNNIILENRDVIVGGMGMADNQYATFKDFTAIRTPQTKQNTFTLGAIYTSLLGVEHEIDPNNYDITYDYAGLLKINKRPLTITVNSYSKIYDGTYLEADGYEIEYCLTDYDVVHSGLLPAHIVEGMEVDGRIIYVGTKKISYTKPKIRYSIGGGYITSEEYVTDYYDITVIDGYLEVTQRPITINVPSYAKEYDGEALLPFFSGEHIGGMGLATGDSILNVVMNGSITDVGSTVASMVSLDFYNGVKLVNYCYKITETTNGTLTVIPRDITISVLGDYKEYYDGGTLYNTGYIVDRLLENLGHTIEFDIVGSQTNVGTSFATVVEDSIIIRNENGVNINFNYNVKELVDGLLEIEKKRPITIESASDKFLFNGKMQGNQTYVIKIDEKSMGLATEREEYELVVFTSEPMVEAGLYTNKFDVDIFVKETGEKVTDNYEIKKIYGIIEIEKIKITITTGSAEKIYDGTPLENDEITFGCDNMPQGYTVEYSASGSITSAGTARNAYKLTVRDENGNEIAKTNFDITENLGTLTVTKLVINVTSGTDEKIYDSYALKCEEYTSNWEETEAFKKDALKFVVVMTGKRTEIGRGNNTFMAFVYDEQGEDVTASNCDIISEMGTLTVYAPPLAFESRDSKGTYDGVPHRFNWAHKSDDGIGHINPDHKVNYKFEGEFINVGEYENYFTVEIVDKSGNSVMEFYPDISYEYGTITIETYKMTIQAPSYKVQYVDGQIVYAPSEIVMPNEYIDELNEKYIDVVYTYSVDDMSDFYAYLPGQKLVYSIPVERFHIFANGAELDKSNMEITSLEGTIKLSEKLVEINLYKIVKAYSGKEVSYKENDWYLRDGQLPAGYVLDLKLSGGRTEVGSLDLDVLLEELLSQGAIHVYNGIGQDVTEDFDFVFVGKPLTVTEKKIQITAGSLEKVYDGEELRCEEYSITGGGLARGHKISKVEFIGDISEVGFSTNTITYVIILDANGVNVTDNYDIELIKGTLTVRPDEQNN